MSHFRTIYLSVFIATIVWLGNSYFIYAADVAKSLELKLKKSPEDLKTREQLGLSYFEKKDYKKIIETLAPYANEISIDSLVNLAKAYSELNDHLNEIRILQIYVDKNGHRFRPHYYLGLAYKKIKKYDQATEQFRQSIQYAPGHRPSYNELLDIFTTTKQNYESRILLNDMIRTFGPKKEFSNLSCKLYTNDNFLIEALAACKKAIKQNPNYPDNHIYLAQNYYNQNNRTAAEKVFKTIGRSYKSSEFAQYAVGEFYLHEKNYPTAVRYLKNAVELKDNELRSQFALSIALFESKNYTLSLTHFDKACKLDKSNETMTLLKNSAARLRQNNLHSTAENFEKKAAVCQRLN